MKSNFLPIIAFLAAIGIFFVYVSPTWSGSIATTKAAIKSDNQALDAVKKYIAQENELATKRSQIDPQDLARLSVFLPDSVDNVRLILDLNALAAHTGLSLSSINVAKNAMSGSTAEVDSGGSPVGAVDLSLSAVGTYTAFQRFLTGVEKSERLLDVKDLTMTGSDTGVYTYQMNLRLYWLH